VQTIFPIKKHNHLCFTQDVRTTPARNDFKSFGGSGSFGGIASATPQMRKRLSRRSPGPELRKSRTIQPPSDVFGPDTVC
jgi:hypothetical protein